MGILLKIYYKLFTKNKGLILDKKDDRDYTLGGIFDKKILRKDGQWLDFLPDGEKQKDPLETMSCTSQSLLNCVEIINKVKWNINKDYSDRFLAKCSGTTHNGNSMRTVLETLRKYYGVVREKQWDGHGFMSWDIYYKAIPKDILNMGQLWIKEYNLKYANVNSNSHDAMMKALKYSPLYTAGFAWMQRNGKYQSYGNANHAFVIVGYVKDEYWLIFDSYAPFVKKLDWNYKFSFTRSIFLNKKETKYNQKAIDKLRKRGLKYIMTVERAGEIFELTDNGLKYLSPKEWNNLNVKRTANEKKLIGITTSLYNTLIK